LRLKAGHDGDADGELRSWAAFARAPQERAKTFSGAAKEPQKSAERHLARGTGGTGFHPGERRRL
jgi:hypothetical protein